MSFRQNVTGPLCPCGKITVAASGTAIQMSANFSYNASPQSQTVAAATVAEYALAFEDVIINSDPANAGGIWVVTYDAQGNAGSKNTDGTVLLYIPKGNIPISLKKYLGGSRFSPYLLGIDADQPGDSAYPVGIVGD